MSPSPTRRAAARTRPGSGSGVPGGSGASPSMHSHRRRPRPPRRAAAPSRRRSLVVAPKLGDAGAGAGREQPRLRCAIWNARLRLAGGRRAVGVVVGGGRRAAVLRRERRGAEGDEVGVVEGWRPARSRGRGTIPSAAARSTRCAGCSRRQSRGRTRSRGSGAARRTAPGSGRRPASRLVYCASAFNNTSEIPARCSPRTHTDANQLKAPSTQPSASSAAARKHIVPPPSNSPSFSWFVTRSNDAACSASATKLYAFPFECRSACAATAALT